MSIQITITEKEILETPNDMVLGRYVRLKFNQEKYVDDDLYDKCLICGKESPYLKSRPIESRVGYVPGGGQACFMPNQCD